MKTTALALAFAALGVTSAAADAPKKSIVLVHGAFADGSSWDKVVPLLEAKGYTVVAVHQPLTSLPDDVAAVKRVIDAQPGDVVLVGHSYGGFIITDAGSNPKVTALVYVAAFGPDTTESITDFGKGQPTPDFQKTLKVADGFASLSDEAVAKDFAPDLSAADQKLIAAKQGWISVKLFDGKPTVAAWKTKPSWAVIAKNDKMIPPAAEEQFAKRMGAKVTTVESSHVAMLAKPAEVAKVILDAAAAKPAAATPAKK